MKHDALLLDFGGVISKTLFECHEATERHYGLAPGTLDWRGPLDPDRDELWQAMLADEITERDYWDQRAAEVGRLIGRPVAIQELVAATRSADPNDAIRPEAVATIRKAKAAGRRVGVLSNELELFYGPKTMARLEILADIDCLVDGSRSNVLKPSPEAYALALAAIGSSAAQTVFVDDQPRNVAGARAMGITSVAFDVRNPAASFRKVGELLEV